jgi:membrane protease YdiL (CAAX protease family)
MSSFVIASIIHLWFPGRQSMAADANTSSPARVAWKIGCVLVSTGLLASLAVVPYLAEIVSATGNEVNGWELTLATASEHLILIAIAVGLGLTLGPKVGLGTPLLAESLSGVPGWSRRLRPAVITALVVGIGVAIAISIFDPWLKSLMPEWPETARNAEAVAEKMVAWKLLLASFSAGVTEELVFRFGGMTLFAWVGARLTRRESPSDSVFWLAIILSALLFGLSHLANVVELGIAITTGTILYVSLTNGVAGVAFGWLYWRRGLGSAMLAHVVADIVLKVVVPVVAEAIWPN